MYHIDSPEDFVRFATDHYGELGLSRLNIFASHDRQQGWNIVVSNSYSANAGLAIEVATALYKTGIPLQMYYAEKLLRILLEDDAFHPHCQIHRIQRAILPFLGGLV